MKLSHIFLLGEHSVYDDDNKKKGKTVKKEKYVREVCYPEDPFTWSTRNYEVEVALKGGYYQPSRQRRGFILGYVQYTDGKYVIF